MWWKLVLLTIYLAVLFVLSRILEAVTHYQGGYLPSRLLDPVSLSVQRLKALLDQRGVSYTGIVERQELTELVQQSGVYFTSTSFIHALVAMVCRDSSKACLLWKSDQLQLFSIFRLCILNAVRCP